MPKCACSLLCSWSEVTKTGEGSWVAAVGIAGLGQCDMTDVVPFEPDVRGKAVDLAFGWLFLLSTAATGRVCMHVINNSNDSGVG